MPGLWSSPVCLTVIWFLSCLLRPSCSQIQANEESGVQYGRLESNVTLACGKSQIRTPVVWLLNKSSVLPWHKTTPDGSLVLLNVDLSAQGNYSCYDDRGLLLHSIKLRLGHPPGLLSISCQVPNHWNVRCSWVDSVKTFLPAKYNASFRGTGQEWKPCVLDFTRRNCIVEDLAFWQITHTLRITETNGLGSETTSARFKVYELLKPDPPESLSVKELSGFPTRLNVSWNFPSSWPLHESFPLMFHVRYKPQGSIYWSEISSERSPVVIFDALANHLHLVQVRARDEGTMDSQWSEWSPPFFAMPWEVLTTPEPTEGRYPDVLFNTIPETSTSKSHNPPTEEEGNLGLVILLVLFSVVILTTVLSLIFVVWVRQRRRELVTKQELTSMVKMKSMPI